MPAGNANGRIDYKYLLKCVEGSLTLALRCARLELSDETVEALENARKVVRTEIKHAEDRA